ncbi:hypothetical protein [Flavobacterium piscis]|uniref:Uncharacterized protein n=1 Tax=Flavobacterium piscis TaxID=1114874 RepID=A0ABU1Y6I7_9FLAO|nr:hypothetical protein [Flavobacterium piscis]MDR7209854.1 hypothetical protein [Flavobacterium piscis]
MTYSQSLEYVMDMVHNNPGEATYETKYNDPAFLKSEGFTATTPHWYINCLITYDNYKKNVIPKKSETRVWIETKAAEVDKKLAECKKAGINVYPFTDFVVFPTAIWEKYGDSIKRNSNGIGNTMGGHGEVMIPDIQRKTTQDLIKAQIKGIFDRFPQLDGLVLRFGETYLFDTPYHKGGSPISGGDDGITDHIIFINLLREEICVKRNKKLFYRTWDWGYKFHDNPEYYLAITNKIEPHPNLIFSIKYPQGDFLRMTPFNPCLGIGKHKQVVEAQSRMEAYGKGAHPYYSAYGVINGWPETKYEIDLNTGSFTGKLNQPSNPQGIKDILNKNILCGVNTWSHGGGWQGPYINNEIWTDLNTYIVSHWAQDTSRSEENLFYEFARKHNISGFQADLFRQIALLSIEGVRKGQCNSYTINDKWWSRDEFFSVRANQNVLNEILKNSLERKVLAEKAEAAAIWRQIEALSNQMSIDDSVLQEAIRVSCSYGRIKYELIEQMWILMIEDSKYNISGQLKNEIVKTSIKRYDDLWNEWRSLKNSSKQCATLYIDLAFRNEKSGSIRELVEKLKIQTKQ